MEDVMLLHHESKYEQRNKSVLNEACVIKLLIRFCVFEVQRCFTLHIFIF